MGRHLTFTCTSRHTQKLMKGIHTNSEHVLNALRCHAHSSGTVAKACNMQFICVDKHSFQYVSLHKHTSRHTLNHTMSNGWVRLFLCLTRINTQPAEERWATESLPGYMEGQTVLSYCTVQPLSTAAPYRVHKAWWMAYHHLPLWWLLNAVTLHQAHARVVRCTKTDRQANPGCNKKKKKEKWQNYVKGGLERITEGWRKRRRKSEQ